MPLPKTIAFVTSQLFTVTLGWKVQIEVRQASKSLQHILANLSELHPGRLQWAPYLKNVVVELRCGSSEWSDGGMAPVDVLEDALKEYSSAIDRALAKLRLSQYTVSLQFPSHWSREDVWLRSLLQSHLPTLYKRNSLVVAISGGKSVCSYASVILNSLQGELSQPPSSGIQRG